MNRFFEKASSPPPPPPPPVEAAPLHPFYPVGIEIANYIANDRDVLTMVASFLGGWVVILGLTWLLTGQLAPQVKRLDKLILIWFVLTGSIHFFFEGYFAYNHARMGSAQDLFGQLWKEYSLSDSRYLTSDPFVLCMETITAVLWGPLSYAVVYCILTSHPLRYPLQAIVSLGQLYGDVLYYATSMFDLYYRDLNYCRPEPYYFWFYFFFMNFIWIVIPSSLLYQSVSLTGQAFSALQHMSMSMQSGTLAKASKGNGHVKTQ